MALSTANSPEPATDASTPKWHGPFPPEIHGADEVVSRAAATAGTEWLCAPALWAVCCGQVLVQWQLCMPSCCLGGPMRTQLALSCVLNKGSGKLRFVLLLPASYLGLLSSATAAAYLLLDMAPCSHLVQHSCSSLTPHAPHRTAPMHQTPAYPSPSSALRLTWPKWNQEQGLRSSSSQFLWDSTAAWTCPVTSAVPWHGRLCMGTGLGLWT